MMIMIMTMIMIMVIMTTTMMTLMVTMIMMMMIAINKLFTFINLPFYLPPKLSSLDTSSNPCRTWHNIPYQQLGSRQTHWLLLAKILKKNKKHKTVKMFLK